MLVHPLPGARLSQGFGEHPNQYGYGAAGHLGLDFACPQGLELAEWFRSPVRAAHDGVATMSPSARGGLGVLLVGADCDTFYCHLDEVLAAEGQRLRAGQTLGLVGHTGETVPEGLGGTHLHFGWRPRPIDWNNGASGYRDPWPLLRDGGLIVDKSKLGAHHNAFLDDQREQLRAFYQLAQPRWALCIEGSGIEKLVNIIRAASPGTQILGRYWRNESDDQPLDNPTANAQTHLERILSSTLWAHGVRDWQGYNEIPGYPYVPNSGSERILNYLRFDMALNDLLAQHGGRLWCGAWSVGNPDYQWWSHPLMRELLQKCPRLLVHEYCAPVLNDPRAFDPPVKDWNSYITSGHYLLRYRQAVRRLREQGVPTPRVLIGECGIDTRAPNGWYAGTPDQLGWRYYYAGDPQGYLEQLKWFDRQLAMDSYVEGALHFCYGTADSRWSTFDISGQLANLLAAHIGAVPPSGEEIVAQMWAAGAANELPYNPDAAFMKYGLAHGWQMKSPEFDIPAGYRGQIFIDTSTQPWEKILVCTRIGAWDPSQFIVDRIAN